MKKIHMIAALLAMLLPITQVWGGGSNTYYAKISAEVTAGSPTGAGTVYAGATEATSSSNYQATSVATGSEDVSWGMGGSDPGKATVTMYLSAKAAYGYVFAGWYRNTEATETAVSTQASYTIPVNSISADENKPTDGGTYFAKFIENTDDYAVSLVAPKGLSSYTVTGPTGFNGSGLSHGGDMTAYKGDSFTFSASVADGYEFVKWTVNGADAGTSTTLTKSFTSASTVQAVVNKLVTYNATCQAAPAGCSYKVGSTTVSSSEYQTSGYGTLTVNLSAPTAASGYMFAGWYEIVDGNKKIISTDSSTTVTKKSDVTLGADFVAITAPVMLATSTGSVDYEDLDAAFEAAKAGDAISVFTDSAINGNAVVYKGSTLNLAAGVTVTVNGTLAVAGTVAGSGTIAGSGTLYKISYLIDQSEVITLKTAYGTECGVLNFAADAHTTKMPRYCRTTVTSNEPNISSGSISLPADKQLWGVLLNGENAYEITVKSPKAVKVSVDTSKEGNYQKSVNRITAITGTVTSDKLTDTANYVLFSNCTITGPVDGSKITNQGVIDCAGKQIKATTNTHYKFCVLCLNGTVYFSANQWQNAKAAFFNCSSVEIYGIKNVSPSYAFYDCGTAENPAVVKFSYYTSTRSDDHKTAYFYNGFYDYDFNQEDDGNDYCHVYGGSYTEAPIGVPTQPDANGVEIEATSPDENGTDYWVVKKKGAVQNVASIGDLSYPTLGKAIDAARNAGDVITLIENITLEDNELVTVPREKSVTILLNDRLISGGKIVNNGTLMLTDSATANCTTVLTVSGGQVDSPIENDGTLDITWGTYKGTIVNKATGVLTVSNGRFEGQITNNGGVITLKGGHFKKSVFTENALLDLGVDTKSEIVTANTAGVDCYSVCIAPNGNFILNNGVYTVTPFDGNEYQLLLNWIKGKTDFASYSANVGDWKSLAELLAFYQAFNNEVIDVSLITDRDVSAGTLQFNGAMGGNSYPLSPAISAGITNRLLSTAMVNAGWSAMSYKYTFTHQAGPFKTVGFSVTTKGTDGVNNNGTLCRVGIELWGNERVVYTFGQKIIAVGAGSNKAMIRPATGAATFYATPQDAFGKVADRGTVMLANDCADNLVLDKAGTYTFDTMGFAFAGEVSVANGLFVKSPTSDDSSAKELVADAKATTYVVAQKVAGVGAQFYDKLTEAVENANGAVVTLYAETAETITLTAEGQSFTLNKNGVEFDDAKVVTTIANGSVTKSVTDAGTVYTAVTSVVDASDGNKYTSVGAAVATVEGNDVAVTVTANVTEEVALPQGKALTVKAAEGVEANVTVTPAEGAFVVSSAVDGGIKYESKKITVKMAEPQAAVAVTKIDNGTESEVSDTAEINAAVAKMTGNNDVPRTDNTDKLDVLDKITVTPTKIVEEVKGGQTVIRSATFDVTPNLNAGQSLAEGQTLKFRLPVDAAATQLSAIAYHNAVQIGVYPVTTENNEKFIEVAASDFSPYGYELLDGETANPVAAIGTTGYATLADAIAAANDGDTVQLLEDVKLSDSLDVDSMFTLDLGGHVIAPAEGTTGSKKFTANSAHDYLIGVKYGGTLSIVDSVGGGAIDGSSLLTALKLTTKGEVFDGETTADLIIGSEDEAGWNNFTVTGDTYGISGNGTRHGTSLYVYGGTVQSVNEQTGTGIYHPQDGVLFIQGGTIRGRNSAVEVRAGDASFWGGNYVVTGDSAYSSTANGSGTTAKGAAIAIAPHTTGRDLTVEVLDGNDASGASFGFTIPQGAVRFAVANPQNVDFDAVNVTVADLGDIFGDSYEIPEQYNWYYDNDMELFGLVKSVAERLDANGAHVGYYSSLAAAIADAQTGDTVQLLANVTENVSVNKAITIDGQTYTLTGDGNSTVLTVDGGVTVEVKNIVIDGAALFNGLDGTVKVTGYSTLALGKGVSIENGIYCNLYLDRGSVTGSQGVTMVGGEAVVNAEGKAMYGEKDITVAVQALSSMLNGGSSLEPETTIGLPYFDIVRQRPDGDIVNIADGEGRVKQGASLLFLANGNFSDAGQETVTLPTRFYSYTLNIANFVGATGWTEGEWNDIIDTGCDTIDLIAGTGQGDKPMSETVDVTLKLNEDVAIPGKDGFEYRNSNFTIDGNNKAISGTIVYTDNAGTMENVVMGTKEAPLVIDMTEVSDAVNLGAGIAVENLTIVMTEAQATEQGKTIVTWVTDEGEEGSFATEDVSVVIVDATSGDPIVDPETQEPKTASLMWDTELGIGYIGPCEARVTGGNPALADPIYTSLANAINLVNNGTGDTITLMMDIENFASSYRIDVPVTFDGASHTITAKENVEPNPGAMLKFAGNSTIRDVTMDGKGRYNYIVEAIGSQLELGQGVTFKNGFWCNVHINGASLTGTAGVTMVGSTATVENGRLMYMDYDYTATFIALSANTPLLAYAGNLKEGMSVGLPFFDIVRESESDEVDISETADGRITQSGTLLFVANGMWNQPELLANVDLPTRFYSYTLDLGGVNATGWTEGEWNDIINTGCTVLEAMSEGLSATVPVTLELNEDVVIPGEFVYSNKNFTVDGQAKALSGTIKYTDDAGIMKNIVLGTEEKPLILDLREVTEPVEIGNLIGVTNVTVLMTAAQATLGQPVFTWNVEIAGEPDNAESVKITVLESAEVPYNPEEEAVEKGLVWDDELGIAYIGPCEARLTGPEREPGYMDLTNAFNMAVGGDTVTLFWSGVTLNEEIAFPAGTLVFATNKYELALGENAAFVFTNATSVFRSELEFSTDIMTLEGKVASGYLLRTAADGTTNVYSVASRGQYIVTGMTEDGMDGTAVIKVSDEWIAANMNKVIAEIKTINEIEEYLDSRDATTGMRKWENYVLKQTEKPFRVSGIAANGALSTTLSDTPEATATTGFTVQYALNEVKADGTVKTSGTKSAGHNFSVAVDSVASSALYKVRAYLTSGESKLVVDSTNTLGVLKVQPTIARSIIAVPWKSLATGGDITVADYIRTADLADDDKLHVYNGDHYDTWTYSGGNWSAVKTFIAGKDGTDTTVSGSAATTTLARGTGVWIERASGTAEKLYLIGEYTPEPVETPITAGSKSAMSWNLVGAPSYEQIDLNTAIGKSVNANAADRIVVPMPNGLQRNYTYKKGKWGYSDAERLENGRVKTYHNTNAVLPAGTGFWYLNTDDAGTIKW